ncbi:MAG: T9SS type A sorting domain-containing protein [Elusimicrobiota bacterium]
MNKSKWHILVISISILICSNFSHGAVNTSLSGNTTLTDTLEDAYAFPNPFRSNNEDHKDITFTELTTEADIEIYTLSGELVRKLTKDPGKLTLTWDLTTDSGDEVLSGVYIYSIKSGTDKKSGLLIVIK